MPIDWGFLGGTCIVVLGSCALGTFAIFLAWREAKRRAAKRQDKA